jgi:deoxyribonuclease V
MLLACLDVDYRPDGTVAACLLFESWEAEAAASEHCLASEAAAADYQPGQFYRRELPFVLPLLSGLARRPELLIVDGYVWLGAERPGFGHALFEALGGEAAVVGVAKNPFHGAEAQQVLRGQSQRPLYVTAVGMEASQAAEGVRRMHGPFRVPTLLRRVDALCRA